MFFQDPRFLSWVQVNFLEDSKVPGWFFVVPDRFYGFSRLQVGFYGFRWVFMVIGGFSWFLVGFHGFSWF